MSGHEKFIIALVGVVAVAVIGHYALQILASLIK